MLVQLSYYIYSVVKIIYKGLVRLLCVPLYYNYYSKIDLFNIILLLFTGDTHEIISFDVNYYVKNSLQPPIYNVLDVSHSLGLPSAIKLYHIQSKQTILEKIITFHVIQYFQHIFSLLPLYDYNSTWKSNAEVLSTLQNLFLVNWCDDKFIYYYKRAVELNKYSSLEFLDYMITYGLCTHLVEKLDDDGYMVDLSFLGNYEVREGLEKYGGKLLIDMNYKVVGINLNNVTYIPSDSNWNYAYNVFTSSIFTYITIINHGLYSHLYFAGNMLYLQSTKLNPESELFKFLNIFLFHTSLINSAAYQFLILPRGVVARIFSYTHSALEELLKNSLIHFNFKTIIDNIMNNNNTANKVFVDAKKYLIVIKSFVTKFVNCTDFSVLEDFYNSFQTFFPMLHSTNLTTKDNIINMLVYHIFNVSFWHEHVGNMFSYTLSGTHFRTKVFSKNKNALYCSIQESVQSFYLTLQTSMMHVPNINGDLYLTQDPCYHIIFQEFQQNLNNLVIECEHLIPDRIECSISL